MDDDFPAASAIVGSKAEASERLPSAAELVLRNARLEQLVGWLLIATPAGSSFATKSVAVAVLHAVQHAASR
jgi:hypothetical protein